MDLNRQKRTARILLVGIILVASAVLYWADPVRRITTDVLDLVPNDERQPELVLVRSLAGEQRAKVALFAVEAAGSPEHRQSAANAFLDALKKSDAFTEVVFLQDTAGRDALGQALFNQRFNLLLPGWLAAHRRNFELLKPKESWPEWLATQATHELLVYLSQPEAIAFQDILPKDPLLLVPKLVESVKGLDTPAAGSGGPLLIWALLSQPPLQERGQKPVFDAVAEALRVAQTIEPNTHIRWTSLARFAAASRQRIEGELSTLNIASILAVLAVAAACLRNLWKAIHLAPVILGSVLFAWTVTMVSFPHVHVLVFVVGSLLTGVAIDYGFYLYLQPPAFAGEPYLSKAGRLLRPLLASALTAILGFSLLLFSDLPLIRQLGIFVSAGLFGALTFALLWFAQVNTPYMETRAFARIRPKPGVSYQRSARTLLICGAAIALIGPWFLNWHDDIRELEIPAQGLQDEAREVRALFGDRDDKAVYLTHGTTVQAARESLDKFLTWHNQSYPNQAITSAAQVLPSASAWAYVPIARTELSDFPVAFRKTLTAEGFEADSFEPFYKAWDNWISTPLPSYQAMASSLTENMHGPLSMIFSISPAGCWFVSVAQHTADRDPPAELSTASSNQLENLNRLFSRYRTSALHLSALGLGLVGLSVFLLYGFKHGIRIFAVPLGACLFTFGLMGLTGQTLNLFHLLGAFLGVCLSHNYSIFSAENEVRHEEPPPSIRLSAFCTAASFGVLTLSHIPVVSALGATVSLIVLSALAIVELKTLAGPTPLPETRSTPTDNA